MELIEITYTYLIGNYKLTVKHDLRKNKTIHIVYKKTDFGWELEPSKSVLSRLLNMVSNKSQ